MINTGTNIYTISRSRGLLWYKPEYNVQYGHDQTAFKAGISIL